MAESNALLVDADQFPLTGARADSCNRPMKYVHLYV
jgi:hypothetical protein